MSVPSQFRTTGTLKDTVETTKPKTTTHTITKAAKPTKHVFDAWNSSSTGHQRADNSLSGSTSWRDSRSAKLKQQFADGQRGGKRLYDTVGAGSQEWGADGRLENGAWEKGAKGLRRGGQLSVLEAFDGKAKVRKPSSQEERHDAKRRKISDIEAQDVEPLEKGDVEAISTKDDNDAHEPTSPDKVPPERQIFRGLTIYINGSTFPLISDHKLKKLLAQHGAHLSIALGRRTVTHVIIGTPNTNGKGAGGALAGGKLQKEIAAVRGKGIKFVGVQWVLDSIQAGRRLQEANFSCLKMATSGQQSVLGTFTK